MALYFNGTQVSNSNNLNINGTNTLKAVFNDTTVWEKSTKTLVSISAVVNTAPMWTAGTSTSEAISSVTATFADGSTASVKSSSTFSPATLSSGTNNYTVSYTFEGTTKTTTVSIYVGSWHTLTTNTIDFYFWEYIGYGKYDVIHSFSLPSNINLRAVRVSGTQLEQYFYYPDPYPEDIYEDRSVPITNALLPLVNEYTESTLEYSKSGNTLYITAFVWSGYDDYFTDYYYLYDGWEINKIEIYY